MSRSKEEIVSFLNKYKSDQYWYQRVKLPYGLVSPGRKDSESKLELLQLPDDLTGKRVLDIGCNVGYFSFEARKRGAEVVGIDSNAQHLEIANELKSILELDVEFKLLNIAHIKELGKFDIVMLLSVYHWLTDIIQPLRNIAHVCRDYLVADVLMSVEANKYVDQNLLEYKYGYIIPSRQAFTMMLKRNGFKSVRNLGVSTRSDRDIIKAYVK